MAIAKILIGSQLVSIKMFKPDKVKIFINVPI